MLEHSVEFAKTKSHIKPVLCTTYTGICKLHPTVKLAVAELRETSGPASDSGGAWYPLREWYPLRDPQ